MNPGYLNQKIIIQKRTTSMDHIGNELEVWIDYKRSYAYVNCISGKEYWEAAQVNSENTVDFILLWHQFIDTIDTKQYRILFKETLYDIKSIDNKQYANRYIKIRGVARE